MNIKNCVPSILNPVILQKIDRYLLLNQPFIWSTRVHYVFYYGLSVNAILILLTVIFIQPNQIDELTQYLVLLLFLLEIGVFFFWMFRQSIFNLEQEYGTQRHFIRRSFVEIIIYVLCILIIFSPSSLISLSAMHKVAYQTKIDKNTSCITGIFEYFLSYEEEESEKELLEKEKKEKKEQFLALYNYDRRYKSRTICSDIQYFTTGVDSYEEDNDSITLPYDIYLFIKAFFISTIGITILIVQKYGNWRSVAWIGFYLVVISGLMIPVLSILEIIKFYFLNFPLWKLKIDNSFGNYFIVITIISLLILFQSYRIIKQAKNSRFLIINVGILFIALNSLFMFIWVIMFDSFGSDHHLYEKIDHASDILQYYKIALLILICLYPFLKKILLRNLSLPTQK